MNTTHGENLEKSDESSRPEIGLAKAQGVAYGSALKYLTSMEANDSGEREIGDYIVAYAIEDAEGLYHIQKGKLDWVEPTAYNCHIEVTVRNAADGRFLPGLSVNAKLFDTGGSKIADLVLPFLWHPWIYHYGANCKVPGDGTYKLQVHVDVPEFPRHDRVNGLRFLQPADAQFEVKIKTGRKLTDAA